MLALYGLGYIFTQQNISIKTLLFEHVLPFVFVKEGDKGKMFMFLCLCTKFI